MGIFNYVDPTSNQRMYLVVYDPGQPNQLYDVVVTNPVTAAVRIAVPHHQPVDSMDLAADEGEAVSSRGNGSRHALTRAVERVHAHTLIVGIMFLHHYY